MSKHKSPAPTVYDALEWLPDDLRLPAQVRVCLYPDREGAKVYVAVELVAVDARARQLVIRRWGESVSARSDGQITSALFRAAVAASQWFDGKSAQDIANYVAWEASAVGMT